MKKQMRTWMKLMKKKYRNPTTTIHSEAGTETRNLTRDPKDLAGLVLDGVQRLVQV
jgi:hypothetical protein